VIQFLFSIIQITSDFFNVKLIFTWDPYQILIAETERPKHKWTNGTEIVF